VEQEKGSLGGIPLGKNGGRKVWETHGEDWSQWKNKGVYSRDLLVGGGKER